MEIKYHGHSSSGDHIATNDAKTRYDISSCLSINMLEFWKLTF